MEYHTHALLFYVARIEAYKANPNLATMQDKAAEYAASHTPEQVTEKLCDLAILLAKTWTRHDPATQEQLVQTYTASDAYTDKTAQFTESLFPTDNTGLVAAARVRAQVRIRTEALEGRVQGCARLHINECNLGYLMTCLEGVFPRANIGPVPAFAEAFEKMVGSLGGYRVDHHGALFSMDCVASVEQDPVLMATCKDAIMYIKPHQPRGIVNPAWDLVLWRATALHRQGRADAVQWGHIAGLVGQLLPQVPIEHIAWRHRYHLGVLRTLNNGEHFVLTRRMDFVEIEDLLLPRYQGPVLDPDDIKPRLLALVGSRPQDDLATQFLTTRLQATRASYELTYVAQYLQGSL